MNLQNNLKTAGSVIGFCLLLIFAILPRTLSGQAIHETDTLTADSTVNLTQAIQIAMANNTAIKRALLSLKTADQQVRSSWGELLPEVSASASYTRNIELPVFFFPADPSDPNSPLQAIQAGEDNNWIAGLSVSQTLFRGEAFVGVNSSKLFKTVQAENLRATTQEIVTQTRLAYYNVLVAQEQVRLQRESLKRLRANLEENQARENAGLIDRYAVLQVEVQLSNQEPQLTQAEYALREAYRELKLVMGLPIQLPLKIKGNLGTFEILNKTATAEVNESIHRVNQMTPYSFAREQKLISIATDLRGDIRLLEQQNALKAREIRAIKAQFLPTLSANYNFNYQAQEPGTPTFFGTDMNRVRTQYFMLTLEVPIFQGFQRSADVQIAQIEKKDLELQKEFAVRSAKNEIASAQEALNEAIETAPAREKALSQAREGYERARKRLENGLGSQIDVTEAEFQLRQAELNYAQTVYDYLSAKARYDIAIGMVPFVDKSKPELE